jgi:dTDP-4-dehydrorhamnose reductase
VRILLTGSNGQVGWELARLLEGRADVVACDRERLDITDREAVARTVAAVRPDAIINAAAYTAVDKAESEPEAARAANALAPGFLAEQAGESGALLVHYSTDYVFDGRKTGAYVEEDAPAPINAYGRTKLEGERAVSASGCRHLILRTSWVYAPRGKNFMLTMLRLARERDEIRVVNDQFGSPTTARMVAECTVQALHRDPGASGLYHLAAAGSTSWHGFAQAIVTAAGLRVRVVPITTADYPTAARRPASSILDSSRFARDFAMAPADWRTGVASTLAALRHGST